MTDQDANIIMLPKVRISFCHLEKPHSPPNSNELKYSADFLLDPTVHATTWQQLTNTILQLANEKWGSIAGAVINQMNADPKLRGYGEGNTRVNKKDMSVLDGYAGQYYITAKSTNAPDLIDQNGKVIDLKNALSGVKKPYAGCYVNGLVRVWLQDNQYGRGARFDLLAVQFAEDGEAFGAGQVETEGYFKPIEGAPPPTSTPPGGMGFM